MTELDLRPIIDEYRELLAGMTETERTNVECLRAQSIGYVWGRQDAGESPKDTGASTDFGYVYGLHCARYSRGVSGFRKTVRDVFEAWVAGTWEVTA
jgi:hypothetical protein